MPRFSQGLSRLSFALLCLFYGVASHANEEALPDPSLFTNTGAPKEQVNDRPLFVFGTNKQTDADAKKETVAPDANKPNPELFTNTGTPKEQHRDRAFSFSSKSAPQSPTNAVPAEAPATPQAEPSETAEATEDDLLPDEDLFTNPGTPKEQVRDRPFRLF